MELFFGAIRSVFDQLSDALKASALPSVLGLTLLALVIFGFGLQNVDATFGNVTNEGSFFGIFFAILTFFVAAFVIFVWVAITWHRVVIENHPVSFFPQFKGLPIGAYIGRSIVLGLMMIAMMIPVGILISMFGLGGINAGLVDINGGASMTAFTIVGTIVGLVLGTLITFFWTRLASTLPAIALGHRPSISEGWSQTKAYSREILIGSFFLNLLYIAIEFIELAAAFISGSGAIGLQVVFGWFTVMVGISFLTKTYELAVPHHNATEIFE